MCLRTKGMPESTAIFTIEAAGQIYNQTDEFVYLGGKVNHNNTSLSIDADRCIRNAWCSFRKYTQKYVTAATCEAEYVALCDASKNARFMIAVVIFLQPELTETRRG